MGQGAGDLRAEIKQELAAPAPVSLESAYSEIATLLRCGGDYEEQSNRSIIVRATFDEYLVAQRLHQLLQYAFHIDAQISDPSVQELRKTPRYSVEFSNQAADILRKLGLRSPRGFRTIGLPPRIVSGQESDHEAAWRGAFLAAGNIAAPGRSTGLEIVCPCVEVSMAFVGCARRLGISAKRKETRGVEKVVIRDNDKVGALLSRMGAHRMRAVWDMQTEHVPPVNVGQRLANFDDANLRRSARAAADSAARIERAMEILGDDIPEQLAQAGMLRLENKRASLEELGRLSDPPLTKDAIAGRIRRLLTLADRRAEELGIAPTNAALQQHGAAKE